MIGANGRSSFGRVPESRRSQRSRPIPAMHDSRPERSRNPTVLTRSSSSPSTEPTFARAAGSFATVTTRKIAASDNGASMLCASIGTLSQFFPDIFGFSAFSRSLFQMSAKRHHSRGSGASTSEPRLRDRKHARNTVNKPVSSNARRFISSARPGMAAERACRKSMPKR